MRSRFLAAWIGVWISAACGGGSGKGVSHIGAGGGSVMTGLAGAGGGSGGTAGSGTAGTGGSGSCQVANISAADGHTCVVLTTGSVRCWGRNDSGQIGNGAAMDLSPPDGRNVLTGARGVGTSIANTCAVTTAGGVRCWGGHLSGVLGLGDSMMDQLRPPTNDVLTGAQSMAVGENHACALMMTGALRCWGNNFRGQLGDGTFTNRTTPVEVLQNVQAVAAGDQHTCALMSSGGVRCWGSFEYDQLGRQPGPQASSVLFGDPVPPEVDTVTDVQAVSCGGRHTCIVTTAGGLRCWGDNQEGQLGDPTVTARVAPPDIDTLTDVKAVAAGGLFTCALMNSGAVRCWGDNINGQLGDGTTTRRATIGPDILSGAQGISAGSLHACAVMTTGSVRCWGYNGNGRLGIGFAMPMSTVPTADLQGLDGVCP